METLYSSSGSRFLNAESCESTVSVVPVRFAFLETLFLSSESICKAFGGDQAADFRNAQKYVFCRANATWSPPEGGPHPPTPHLPVRVLTSLKSFALVLQCVLQHVRTRAQGGDIEESLISNRECSKHVD